MASPVPVRAAEAPFAVQVEQGKDYWWCACGLSQSQPFCDGSHKKPV
jgi:CDGSH-type Zn-finger protein